MTTATTPAPWQATLHLEVRSRGRRPGQSNTEQRVYTATVPANQKEPNHPLLNMIRTSENAQGFIFQSATTWFPAEFDAALRTATFRESLRRSDRLVDELEAYGWSRRRDLEAACSG